MLPSTSSSSLVDLTTTSPFQNCWGYQGARDDKYAECLHNTSGDPCYLIEELHKAKDFRGFLAVVPFILSVITIVLNGIFIYLIYLHVIRKSRSSRKRYTFLINRSVAAIIAQILLYVVLITWRLHKFKYSSATLFLLVGGLSFSMYTFTYLIMTFLLYKAVTMPFWYKKWVTIQRCLISLVIVWLLSIAFSIVLGLYGATLFYPDTTPIKCPFHSCQWPLSISLVVILTACYITVIAFYVAMVLRIKWMNDQMLTNDLNSSNKSQKRSLTTTRNIKTMNRLSLNLFAFSLSKVPLIIIAMVSLANLSSLRNLGMGTKQPCKTFHYSRLFYGCEILASIAAIFWMLGMLIDPLISIWSDPTLMEDLRKRFRQVNRLALQLCRADLSQKSPLAQMQVADDTNSGEF